MHAYLYLLNQYLRILKISGYDLQFKNLFYKNINLNLDKYKTI